MTRNKKIMIGTPEPRMAPAPVKRPTVYVWTLAEAQTLLQRLEAPGWGFGLCGSVVRDGRSQNDVDVIAFPLRTNDLPNLSDVHRALRALGFRMQFSAGEVREYWRRKGSDDTKHVEVWRDSHGRKLDLFAFGGGTSAHR